MHPADCPSWEYRDNPESSPQLTRATAGILAALRTGSIDSARTATDTRQSHGQMFRSLTPSNCAYYAGHYRGEQFRCLEYLQVGIPSDRRVGCPPDQVLNQMNALRDLISVSIAGLDAGHSLPNAQLNINQKILYCVCVACRIFELFNRIHPYANGNGHAARLCLIAILGRYDYWVKDWSIEPRPPDPPYTDLIVKYRNGNKEPLERFILGSIIA